MYQQRAPAPILESNTSKRAVIDVSHDDDDDWLPKELQKPPNQCQLTEEELDEEFTRILNANNPLAPQNIARYNFKEKTFKCSPNVDHLVVHLDISGYLILKNDVEEKPVKSVEETETEEKATNTEESGEKKETTEKETNTEGTTENAENTENAQPTPEQAEPAQPQSQPQPTPQDDSNAANNSKNPFNFSERALQTFNNLSRETSTNTEPPPKNTFSDTVTQWSIFDEYVNDLAQKEKANKEKAKPAFGAKNKEDDHTYELPPENHIEDVYYRDPELKMSIRKIERMTNQNTHDEITQDFKYWDDVADEIKGLKNSNARLLPLWKFVYKKEKKKHVTALCWNPCLSDFFVVGYGSYNFSKQGPGLIACFTLKNPSYPEFVYNTNSGVMCIDVYKKIPSLIAVGMYDGTVAVYDLARKSELPLYKSSIKTGKHTDPVWEIKWQKDDLYDHPNFFSISSDGKIIQWTLLKNELQKMDIIVLRNDKELSIKMVDPQKIETESEDDNIKALIEKESNEEIAFDYASGSCFDFNPLDNNIFVVGTEEGNIFKCSTSYNKQYLMTYEGHQMAIYCTKYNKFHPRIFLSASADWTIKLWDHDYDKPIITFDLNSPVSSIEWSPYSSTIFAAVTNEGKIYIYELNEKKYEPVCEQQIVKKARLTHIRFNKFEPILLVGDDKGNIYSLKLPPSLRKHSKEPKDEMQKIEKIILTTSGRMPQNN
ncbi:WD40 repeat-like protein [Neocallimastix lanati (nom. inval.)]|jgi:dynein intermediate chain 1|uniref:WD40 repeat-like protein n=1 Tax=Neocallimastix californiae TaxID=1754190 RepID=A0A1Y2AHW4_9FUNG|nr:WD40 repeat-like protein [Neocallimastix sp. JGI-2020a]ORY22161.1 WD40 repeat-like protein [Neocallimastix californiae]|eukprot:ORY22161.1 WD40 repeat-like protein [Neocallimastix californiae]